MNLLIPGLESTAIASLDSGSESTPTGILSLLWAAINERSLQADAEGLLADRFGVLVLFACSSYGITTLIMALILNRTAVIASTRRLGHTRGRQSRWRAVFGNDLSKFIVLNCLRTSAMAFLAIQIKNLLTTLWVLQKTGDITRLARLTRMIPTRYFEYVPQDFVMLYMEMPRNEVRFGPTSAMLWPVFCSLCFSLFTETFCASISGDKPFLGGGTTLFEVAIAIQGVSPGLINFEGVRVAKRPSEKVLIICLFLLADHFLSQMGSIANKNRYRLIPLTITSTLFLWYFTSSFFSNVFEAFDFPSSISTVYLCLLFALFVSFVSLVIFVLALLAKASNPEELNYASYLWSTDDEIDFFSKHLNVSLSQDFYTAAMNFGLFAVSLAGKSSYIKEYSIISSGADTWLEKSLWEKIQSKFKINTFSRKSRLVKNGKILAYLKENNLTGYSNVVVTPSTRLVQGTEQRCDEEDKLPIILMRYQYMRAIIVRFSQLLYSWIFRFFLRQYIPRVFRKILRINARSADGEEGSEFQTRRELAPAFIRPILKPPKAMENEFSGFRLENISEENLAEQYALILADKDLADFDPSPDFLIESEFELEADIESDADELEISQTCTVSRPNYRVPGPISLDAFSEIMTPENIADLLQEENIDLLREHLHHDPSEEGILTRSRYRKKVALKIPQDEDSKLLDLLLSKRKARTPTNVSADEDEIEDIDPRFACVICQVCPRDIITWPCKCFSICEGCRLSLVAKGLEGCVTCRRDVEGVSRVFLP